MGISCHVIGPIITYLTCFLAAYDLPVNQGAEILEFLAAPIEFHRIDTISLDTSTILDTFVTQYNQIKPKLQKPILVSVRKLLDNSYFPSWTMASAKHIIIVFQSKDKKCPWAEYFGTDIKVEPHIWRSWRISRRLCWRMPRVSSTSLQPSASWSSSQCLAIGVWFVWCHLSTQTLQILSHANKGICQLFSQGNRRHQESYSWSKFANWQSTQDVALTKQYRSFNGLNPCPWLVPDKTCKCGQTIF